MSANQPIFHERALWSLEDIAAYAKKSKSRVRDAIVCQPDFPNAIRETPRAHPRWRAGDVWRWFERRAA
jgi:hypothetical protein